MLNLLFFHAIIVLTLKKTRHVLKLCESLLMLSLSADWQLIIKFKEGDQRSWSAKMISFLTFKQ